MQRGDTLWDIAERFLGDGLRWREIRAANVDRRQPGGTALATDGEDIQPGWTLVIPGRVSTDPSTTGHDPEREVTVAPGDTLWDLADAHLGDPHRWPDIYEANRARPQPDGDSLTDPDLIRPGWELQLPDLDAPETLIDPAEADQDQPTVELEGSDAEASSTGPSLDREPLGSAIDAGTAQDRHAEVAAPTARAGPHDVRPERTRPMEERHPAEPADEAPADGSDQNPFALATSAAVLAAGVILTLDRLRRARLRGRKPDTRIPLPEGRAAEAERRLRTLADTETATFIDLALRELARSSEEGNFPPVTLVTVSTDDLAVHLAGSQSQPPEGWDAHDEGRTWVHRRSAEGSDPVGARGAVSRLPALVTIGATDDGRTALLNLGHTGCLYLDGDDEQAAGFLRAWALELATTQRADALDVVTYGIEELPSDLERLEATDEEDDLLERLSAQPTDSHGPATVLLAAGVRKKALSWIRVATEQRTDLVAAVAGSPPRPGAWSIRFDGEHASLQPEGLTFVPFDLAGTGFDQASRLLDQAKQEEDRPVPIPPLPDDEATLGSEDDVGAGVTVRILGKVEVEGAGRFISNKTMELVVYLAMRREGADTDTLQEALWPDQPPRPARLYTEASRARKALGTAPDGTPHLASADMGIYRLSAAVALDYEQFQAHVAEAHRNPDDAEHHLRAALDLVHGRPLSKTATEYAWSINDSYRIAQEIVDAAHELAQLLIDQERYDEAAKAAEDGLKADPVAEVLIRDLMEAAAATGNAARVHALMSRLRRQIAEDGDANDADDYLHPETIATFERLGASSSGRS